MPSKTQSTTWRAPLPDSLLVPAPLPAQANCTTPAIPDIGEFVWCSVFSPRIYDGNQSIVIRLNSWPAREWLCSTAGFLGQTETSFFVLGPNGLEIRWFAGDHEVPLCGHCALAVNAVLLPMLQDGELREVVNLPGRLWLSRQGGDPYITLKAISLAPIANETVPLGVKVVQAFDAGRDYLVILEDEETLRKFDPRTAGIERLAKIGCIISSPCKSGTAAFRFFAPRVGIQEDRASGSVVPALMQYWARGTPGDHTFSQESGHDIKIRARWLEDKVALTGEVLEFARGKISL